MHGLADELGPEGAAPQTVDLKFAAAPGAAIEVCFEPVGTTFRLVDGDFVFLRVPVAAVPSIEVVVWPNGIGVWVPYPGEYVILNSDGMELDTL
jgi:hypothetical protein